MEYRPIGKTGMSAGIVGLGAEHLDNKPYEVVEEVIHAALEQGINMMDLFMPGDTVRAPWPGTGRKCRFRGTSARWISENSMT